MRSGFFTKTEDARNSGSLRELKRRYAIMHMTSILSICILTLFKLGGIYFDSGCPIGERSPSYAPTLRP